MPHLRRRIAESRHGCSEFQFDDARIDHIVLDYFSHAQEHKHDEAMPNLNATGQHKARIARSRSYHWNKLASPRSIRAHD